MSCDFYFKKWRATLKRLEDIVHFDLDYQTSRIHDKKRCQATLRLSSVLCQYMAIYNDIIDCVNQNLQVQKIVYMNHVLETVISRILELKSDLCKLECSDCQFFGHGLVENHLTMYNTEMLELPTKVKRSLRIEAMIEETFERAKERRETMILKVEDEKQQSIPSEKVINWWDMDETSDSSNISEKELDEKLSLETLRKTEYLVLIQAHEKSRQVACWIRYRNYKRELWAKELSGDAPLPAPYKIREKSARLIQKVFRAYFKLKRERIKGCKRDEVLGIRQCVMPNTEAQIKAEKVKEHRFHRLKECENEYMELYDKRKKQYLKSNGDQIMEEWRDFMRDWFHRWFEEIQCFHNIPSQKQGGPAIIVKDEIQSPSEWLEEYKRYIEEKATNKNKTAMQIKYEKMGAKRLEMIVKKEEMMKKKLEKILFEKMMKNPNMHPGFRFPESKKTLPILEIIDKYKNEWNIFDSLESSEVTEKLVEEVLLNNVCMEAKLKMLDSIDSDMRIELKILKTALKNDYARNGEKMPEVKKKPTIRSRRKLKIKATLSENVMDRMEELTIRGILKEYKKIKLEDFIGDPNFAGEDLRCSYTVAEHHNGDIRYMWWDSCRETAHGVHKRLLVGPKGSGRSRLVQILASVNDAMLFELDPLKLEIELITPIYLEQLVNSVASCAKAVQPSVIHIKNIQKLYYSKVPQYEKDFNLDLIKRYFIKRLLKKIHNTDKITIIGSCENPWITKSKQMLRQFPSVVLLPNATYSIVVQMLKDWILRYPVIPRDLDVNSLAYMLQGYTYGYLEESLKKMLSPERTIRVAAYGLSAEEVYDYIIGDKVEPKPEYEKYTKWYTEKTNWGVKEKRHVEEQQEFKRNLEKYLEKAKKKQPVSSVPSSNLSSETIN